VWEENILNPRYRNMVLETYAKVEGIVTVDASASVEDIVKKIVSLL
jgi:hypothetical protein